MKNVLLLVSLSMLLSGCAILNPYESESMCPKGFTGKCLSIKNAYDESKTGKDGWIPPSKKGEVESCPSGACSGGSAGQQGLPLNPEDRNYSAYRTSLYNKLDTLLKEPNTPVVAPPKVMRIRLLPYRGKDGEFYMLRHVYFFVDEPKWVLGEGIENVED